MENDHPLLQSAVLLSQIAEISTVDVKTILYHTTPAWVCKIKCAKEVFFQSWLLLKGIDLFAGERKEVPGLKFPCKDLTSLPVFILFDL